MPRLQGPDAARVLPPRRDAGAGRQAGRVVTKSSKRKLERSRYLARLLDEQGVVSPPTVRTLRLIFHAGGDIRELRVPYAEPPTVLNIPYKAVVPEPPTLEDFLSLTYAGRDVEVIR